MYPGAANHVRHEEILVLREHGDKAKSIWTHLDDSASEWSSLLGWRFLPLASPASAGLFRTPALPKLNRSPSEAPLSQSNCRLLIVGGRHLLRNIRLIATELGMAKNALLRRAIQGCGLLVIVLETHARPYTAQPWGWLPSYGAVARLTRRSFRRLATRARNLECTVARLHGIYAKGTLSRRGLAARRQARRSGVTGARS